MARRLLPVLAALLLQAAASGALAQSSPRAAAKVATGKRVFQSHCAPCHGMGPGDDGSKMLPGTAALEAKYKGERPAALERRKDLSPEVLKIIVRNGSGAMPMFRKVEISDAEIDAVAAYLAQSANEASHH